VALLVLPDVDERSNGPERLNHLPTGGARAVRILERLAERLD